jgi:signal transduction histidine kinase
LPFVFDPFFTTKSTGVGMGLCRARQIIADHGGDLRMESIEGVGTKVRIRMPGAMDPSTAAKKDSMMEIAHEEPSRVGGAP